MLLILSKMKCPVCGSEANATGKEWKFGQFDAEGYKCPACGKSFSAYYKEGKLSHTVPKSK
jgi:transposase-like protein